jgi:hypothetical protein
MRRPLHKNLIVGSIAIGTVMASSLALALPGYGLSATGVTRTIDISLNTDIDPIRGSLGKYKLTSEDGRVAVVGANGFDIFSDTQEFTQMDAVDAEFNTLQYLWILKTDFGMDGLDNANTPIKLQIGMKYPDLAADPCTGIVADRDALPMASWSPEQHTAYFSGATPWTKPFGSSYTIMFHELTHGVTSATSRLGMDGETGSLNEAFSDIMAMYMLNRLEPKSFSWVMADDVQIDKTCAGTRSLNKPTDGLYWVDGGAGNPAVKEHVRDYYPTRYTGVEDAHGAHINSGIPAFAFYLLSSGSDGTHSHGQKVIGIGIEKAGAVFFRGFTRYLKSDAQMKDARAATIKAAHEIDPASTASVEAAWAGVGL